MELRDDDAFWAARRVMAFTDDLIRAAVRTGQYSDAAAADHLVDVLKKRRDTIGRTYSTAVNPVVNPQLDAAGTLTFDTAAVLAGVAEPPVEYPGGMVSLRQRDGRCAADRRDAERRHDNAVAARPGGGARCVRPD